MARGSSLTSLTIYPGFEQVAQMDRSFRISGLSPGCEDVWRHDDVHLGALHSAQQVRVPEELRELPNAACDLSARRICSNEASVRTALAPSEVLLYNQKHMPVVVKAVLASHFGVSEFTTHLRLPILVV